MAKRRAGYKSFLLRLWRADNGGEPVWRFSLQETGSRQRLIFHGANALQAFLANLTTEQDADEDQSGSAGNDAQPSDSFKEK
jgi:hypothetical protein